MDPQSEAALRLALAAQTAFFKNLMLRLISKGLMENADAAAILRDTARSFEGDTAGPMKEFCSTWQHVADLAEREGRLN